jgi:hypothetical protein
MLVAVTVSRHDLTDLSVLLRLMPANVTWNLDHWEGVVFNTFAKFLLYQK